MCYPFHNLDRLPDPSEPADVVPAYFAQDIPMTQTAAAPATAAPAPAATAAAEPDDLVKGWHLFPTDPPKGKAPCMYIVRRREFGDIVLEFLSWSTVMIPVPGAIVKGHAFLRGLSSEPVTDVEAWRAIPASWTK